MGMPGEVNATPADGRLGVEVTDPPDDVEGRSTLSQNVPFLQNLLVISLGDCLLRLMLTLYRSLTALV